MNKDWVAPEWREISERQKAFMQGGRILGEAYRSDNGAFQWNCIPHRNHNHTSISMEHAVAECEANFWRYAWRELAQKATEKEVSDSFLEKREHVPHDTERMCRDHFNEPVIVTGSRGIAGLQIARLVGYAEDDRDCYLILHYPQGNDRAPQVVYHTAVGGYHFLDRLKGQNLVVSYKGDRWDDLYRIDSSIELAGAPKVLEFISEKNHGHNVTDDLYETGGKNEEVGGDIEICRYRAIEGDDSLWWTEDAEGFWHLKKNGVEIAEAGATYAGSGLWRLDTLSDFQIAESLDDAKSKCLAAATSI